MAWRGIYITKEESIPKKLRGRESIETQLGSFSSHHFAITYDPRKPNQFPIWSKLAKKLLNMTPDYEFLLKIILQQIHKSLFIFQNW